MNNKYENIVQLLKWIRVSSHVKIMFPMWNLLFIDSSWQSNTVF